MTSFTTHSTTTSPQKRHNKTPVSPKTPSKNIDPPQDKNPTSNFTTGEE
jgi:hypothetical protein